MNTIVRKVKEAVFSAKGKLAAVAASAGFLALSSAPAQAALSTEESAMVSVVTGKLTDLVSAVSSIATANLGLIAAIVVAALIITYMKSAGR